MKKLKNAYLYFFDIILKVCIYLPSFKSEKMSLLIVDNFEPSFLVTGFRVKEFVWLLKNVKDCKLLTFSNFMYKCSDLRKQRKEKNIVWNEPWSYSVYYCYKKFFCNKFQLDYNKLVYMFNKTYQAKGAYLMFLYNAYIAKEFLEKNNIPFAFTLFPGGGFCLNQSFSDHMLKSVFSSPMFRGCYCPQKVVYDYILERNFCSKDKLFYRYGGGFFQITKNDIITKKYYKKDKKTVDIAFIAYRYMPKGIDKGFDLFLDVARIIVKRYPFVHFHNVGLCTIDDFEDSYEDILPNYHSYGSREACFFPQFYSKIDIVLSPNRINVLKKGAFDGFPMAVEASYCGSALFCTNPMRAKTDYVDKKHLVVIQPIVEDIVNKIEYYINHLNELYQLSSVGQKLTQEIFDLKRQKKDRAEFIEKFLEIKIKV